MVHRPLQRTNLTVSRICLGTMPFGSQTDEATSLRMIDVALDAGVNFIDTANVYSGGRSEEIVGKAIKRRRDDVVLATKARGCMGPEPDQEGLSRAAIRRAVDDSLARLGVDHVDILYLHEPDRAVPIEESLEALDEAVRAGKVRYPACSNYSAWQVTEMLWAADQAGLQPIAATQPMYNLLARGVEQELMPMLRRFGLASVAYNPLAGGLLTGKQRAGEPLAGSRFDPERHRLGKQYLDRYWHEDMFDAVEELRLLGAASDRSLIALAFSWLLHHTDVDSVILGASTVEQLEQNLAAVEAGPLSAEVVDGCDRVWAKLRGVSPTYNR